MDWERPEVDQKLTVLSAYMEEIHLTDFFFSSSVQDYIFALLTGYTDPPAGLDVPEGMNL